MSSIADMIQRGLERMRASAATSEQEKTMAELGLVRQAVVPKPLDPADAALREAMGARVPTVQPEPSATFGPDVYSSTTKIDFSQVTFEQGDGPSGRVKNEFSANLSLDPDGKQQAPKTRLPRMGM